MVNTEEIAHILQSLNVSEVRSNIVSRSLERPLTRFQLLKTREQKKLSYLASARPGVDILGRFLNVQHHKVAHATQNFFSSDARLRNCHKCFSHYHPSLHQPDEESSSLSGFQQQMQKSLYLSISSIRRMVRLNYAGVL